MSTRTTTTHARVTHLLTQMQHKHNNRQHRRRDHHRQGHPRDPLPRPQIQLLPPPVALERRDDHELRVRDHAFHVNVVILCVLGRADEEVLDVVVRAAEPEVGVGREEGLVGGLWELADWDSGGQSAVCER